MKTNHLCISHFSFKMWFGPFVGTCMKWECQSTVFTPIECHYQSECTINDENFMHLTEFLFWNFQIATLQEVQILLQNALFHLRILDSNFLHALIYTALMKIDLGAPLNKIEMVIIFLILGTGDIVKRIQPALCLVGIKWEKYKVSLHITGSTISFLSATFHSELGSSLIPYRVFKH